MGRIGVSHSTGYLGSILTYTRGAYSVGAHLVANDGDNEGLFRAGMIVSALQFLES